MVAQSSRDYLLILGSAICWPRLWSTDWRDYPPRPDPGAVSGKPHGRYVSHRSEVWPCDIWNGFVLILFWIINFKF